ncbi:MAG: hypothetical protein KDA85_05050 [Planctomycetaceae bacterium]|nr:hypothetical protein [Planctomycetaceae bacterium]
MNDQRFSQSDEADQFRGDVLLWLLNRIQQPAMPGQVAENAEQKPPRLILPVSDARLPQLIRILRGGRLLMSSDDRREIRQITTEEWTTLADAILKWWELTPNSQQKQELANVLIELHASALPDRSLPFLRRRVAEGSAEFEISNREALYQALMQQQWTDELEDELFALLPTLQPTQTPDGKGGMTAIPEGVRSAGLVPQLYQLVDVAINGRVHAAQRAIQDQGDVDDATSTERRESAADIQKAAREAVAERLRHFEQTHRESLPTFAEWIRADRIYLDILLERNRNESIQWAWEVVGDAPPKFVPPAEADPESNQDELPSSSLDQEAVNRVVVEQLRSALKQRAWITLLNLAARRNAGERLTERVLDYIDAGIQSAADATAWANEQLQEEGDSEDDRVDFTLGWKQTKHDALILFDRPDELIVVLRQWIAQDKWNIPWRRHLATLLAERGELKDAIALLESVERDDQLSSQDYAMLANWYQVVDQRENYERGRIAAFSAFPEHQLNQLLNQKYQQLNSGQGPTELDEEVLLIVRALFEKTSRPSSYYSTIRNLYTATRDFRMLEMIAESLLGQSQERTYSALNGLQNSLVVEVRNEATADEILRHVHQLRDRINGGWVPRGADANVRSQTLDLRALDLLESMVERRASEVLNQPGPHGRAALTTLQRAFAHEWQTGERLRYVQLMQQIGAVTNERNHPTLTPLADEQLRQLQRLYEDSEPGSHDRAHIGMIHSHLLFYGYQRRDDAMLKAESTLREYAAANGGLVPYSDNNLVQQYANQLMDADRFQEAENYVQRHLDALNGEGERWTYVSYLNQLYYRAFVSGSRVSLGEGRSLFDNQLKRMEQQCDTTDDNRRYQTLQSIGALFDHAISSKLTIVPDAKKRLLEFGHQKLHGLMQPLQDNYGSVVQHFDGIIQSRIDVLESFDFLLDQYERYPARFLYGNNHPWQQHGWQLAYHRFYAQQLTANGGARADQRPRFDDLETRLLAMTLKGLRTDLINQQGRQNGLYHIGNSYFWIAKSEDFLRVTLEVLREREDSPRTIVYVCHYLFDGLHQFDRAIDILFQTRQRGLLDDDGQLKLVDFLHRRERYAESIAVLEPIMERRPDEMGLRVLLLRALYHSKRALQLQELTEATDAHFHKDGRWLEGNIIPFARVCAESQQHERAAGYFEEAISLHQNSQPNRGIGDGALSRYYLELAGVYSAFGDDERAVDAAAAAVVSWGPQADQRQDALNQLKTTVTAIRDLPAFLRTLNARAEKTGQDSPLLRKIVGNVLQQKNELEEAVRQYQLSLELQPFDGEVHQGLVQCYQKMHAKDQVIRQLLAQIDFDRHNPALYRQLVEETQDRPEVAERAATSLVEQAPTEAESHQALAELRETQDRYPEAVSHWKRVAELRSLEPTGLLKLAKAQLHTEDFTGAKQTIKTLRSRQWPERFGDIDDQARSLEQGLSP